MKKAPKIAEADNYSRYLEGELGERVQREYKFHPLRRWRFDYAIPDYGIAIEIEGGVWTGGRHTSAAGFAKDMEKYNTASSMGWTVLRFQPREQYTTTTLDVIRETMSANKDIKLTTRIDAETWAHLKMICEEAKINSPYKLAQIIINWFVDYYKSQRTQRKETLTDSIRAEIQEEFDRLSDEMGREKETAYTTDRRNGR